MDTRALSVVMIPAWGKGKGGGERGEKGERGGGRGDRVREGGGGVGVGERN